MGKSDERLSYRGRRNREKDKKTETREEWDADVSRARTNYAVSVVKKCCHGIPVEVSARAHLLAQERPLGEGFLRSRLGQRKLRFRVRDMCDGEQAEMIGSPDRNCIDFARYKVSRK